jgi:hypothetical protein
VAPLSPGDRAHATLMLVVAPVLVAAYWTLYFRTDLTRPAFVIAPAGADDAQRAAVYLGFEGAFPLPDAFVALAFALGGFYLLARDPKAVLFGLVGAGGMLFLALIDIWFNVAAGLYAPALLAADPGMQAEIAINAACLAGGVWTALRLWGHDLRRQGPSPLG